MESAPDPPARVKDAPLRPVLIWDGDCTFCALWVDRLRQHSPMAIECVPARQLGTRFPEIDRAELTRAVCLVGPEGRMCWGGEAVVSALAWRGRAWPHRLYRYVPGARHLVECGYRFVARHRSAALWLTRRLWGHDVQLPRYSISVPLFLRLLGLTFLVAFLSLWAQIHGLVGSTGIMPAASYLSAIADVSGPERFWFLPTLGWWSASDMALHGFCAAGVALSAVLMAGFMPSLCLAGLWLLYLSLASLGGVFLNFQWDSLLLETGLVSVFLAIGTRRLGLRSDHRYSRVARMLLVWVLFRVLFHSGVVKLASGDPAWATLSALKYHFETQPLPTWIGWYLHQMPDFIAKALGFGVFFTELVIPWLLWGPRRLRHAAAFWLLFYQLALVLTGNSGFLPLLMAALCILLLDDSLWPMRLTSSPRDRAQSVQATALRVRVQRTLAIVGTLLCLTLTLPPSLTVLRWPSVEQMTKPLASLASPLRSFNRYGMYAVMTTRRLEIVVEGTEDGRNWKPYTFRFKPGALQTGPGFLPGHMPRLDWSMWFAALGSYDRQPWFLPFLHRLAASEPVVMGLLAADPLGGRPPRKIRARLFQYRFTDWTERRSTGHWWERSVRGEYAPTLELSPDPGGGLLAAWLQVGGWKAGTIRPPLAYLYAGARWEGDHSSGRTLCTTRNQ